MHIVYLWNWDHSVYAFRQWETVLQCNALSHWLDALTERRPFCVCVTNQWETVLQWNGISHWLNAFTEWSLSCTCSHTEKIYNTNQEVKVPAMGSSTMTLYFIRADQEHMFASIACNHAILTHRNNMAAPFCLWYFHDYASDWNLWCLKHWGG